MMSIVSTAQNTEIYNFPKDDLSVSPDDFTVTAASATQFEVQLIVDEVSLARITAEGQFVNFENVVGMTFTEASSIMTGPYSTQTVAFPNDDGNTGREVLVYDPPKILEPTTTFATSFEDEAADYAGNDVFIGDRDTPVGDTVHGYGGDDRFVMTYGNPNPYHFRGGDGIDTAVVESSSEHWSITPTTSAFNALTETNDLTGFNVIDTRVVDTDTYGANGHTLQIVEVERLEFTDTSVALDFDPGENGYRAAALITTLFGADTVSEYFAAGLDLVDQGATDAQIAQLVIDYGLLDTSSNTEFFSTIYQNVTGIAPDLLTQALYVNQLDSGSLSQAGLVAIGSSAPVVQSQMSDLTTWQETGLAYIGF